MRAQHVQRRACHLGQLCAKAVPPTRGLRRSRRRARQTRDISTTQLLRHTPLAPPHRAPLAAPRRLATASRAGRACAAGTAPSLSTACRPRARRVWGLLRLEFGNATACTLCSSGTYSAGGVSLSRPAPQTRALLLAPPRSLRIRATTPTAAAQSSPARPQCAAQCPP